VIWPPGRGVDRSWRAGAIASLDEWQPKAIQALGEPWASMGEKSNPIQIGSLIRKLTGGLASREPLYAVWEVWESTVGQLVARHTWPSRLRDGILIVAVDSSTWMHELHYQKRALCKRLTQAVPQLRINDLYLVMKESCPEPPQPEEAGQQSAKPGDAPAAPVAPQLDRHEGRLGEKELDSLLQRWMTAWQNKRRDG